jgi:hypothetical protein
MAKEFAAVVVREYRRRRSQIERRIGAPQQVDALDQGRIAFQSLGRMVDSLKLMSVRPTLVSNQR